MSQVEEFLEQHGASEDLRTLGKDSPSMRELWRTCPRADWMLWILDHTPERNQRELRLFACWCARRFVHLMYDGRLKTAVNLAELFVQGHASKSELRRAAGAAADAADDIPTTDTQQVWLAKLAWATTNDSPIGAAMQASMYSAMLARESGGAPLRAGWLDAMRRQADKLREIIPNPFT